MCNMCASFFIYFPLECLGLSDRRAVSPFRTEIIKVEFKSIASDKHNYKVVWKPLKEFLFDREY